MGQSKSKNTWCLLIWSLLLFSNTYRNDKTLTELNWLQHLAASGAREGNEVEGGPHKELPVLSSGYEIVKFIVVL